MSTVITTDRDETSPVRAESGYAINFQTNSYNTIVRITKDGRLERGEQFRTDDHASVALFDCMARVFPDLAGGLLQRAERAEAELALLKDARA